MLWDIIGLQNAAYNGGKDQKTYKNAILGHLCKSAKFLIGFRKNPEVDLV